MVKNMLQSYADVPIIITTAYFIGKANNNDNSKFGGKWMNSDFGIMHVVLNKFVQYEL